MATLIELELDQRVVITENGRKLSLTKRQLIAKRAVNTAVAGDPRPLLQIQKHAGGQPSRPSGAEDSPAHNKDDQEILENWKRRLAEGEQE